MCRFLYIEKGKKKIFCLVFVSFLEEKRNKTKQKAARQNGLVNDSFSLPSFGCGLPLLRQHRRRRRRRRRWQQKSGRIKKKELNERKNGRTNERKRCSIHQKEEERKKIITVEPINARRKHRLQPVASLLHVWGFHLKFRFQVWNIPFLFGEGGG